MVAYRLKERTKHHAWQDGNLVKLNPGAIVSSINPRFRDKFDLIDDVPEDRIVKLDRPEQPVPTRHIIQDAVGQQPLVEPDPEPQPVAPPPKPEPLVVTTAPYDESEDDDEEDEKRVLSAINKRGNKWIVVDQDGEKTHTGYYTKNQAEKIAAEG